jgi:predicted Fe-Mo cluster-binding NifX family protein
VFVDIADDQIERVEVLPNPYYENHTPRAVPAFIHEQGADVMVTGGMGRRAITLFEQYQIKPYTGAVGTVRRVLAQFHGGTLTEAEPCKDHIAHATAHAGHKNCES